MSDDSDEVFYSSFAAPVFLPQETPVSVTLQPGMEQKCNFKIPADEAAVEV